MYFRVSCWVLTLPESVSSSLCYILISKADHVTKIVSGLRSQGTVSELSYYDGSVQ